MFYFLCVYAVSCQYRISHIWEIFYKRYSNFLNFRLCFLYRNKVFEININFIKLENKSYLCGIIMNNIKENEKFLKAIYISVSEYLKQNEPD